MENCDDEAQQTKLRKEGGYNHFDWLEISRDTTPDYDEKVHDFCCSGVGVIIMILIINGVFLSLCKLSRVNM